MDKKEFGVFASALRTYYPRETILPNQPAMELWYRELADIPAQVAEMSLRKWVATNKWSPSIADIRETAATITNGEPLTWGESWELALQAVRKFGSYRPGEAMASLDPLTRRCVKNIGYMQLCMSENIATDRANYRMIFETMAQREQMEKQLALPLQEAISMARLSETDKRLKIGQGE